MAVEARLNAPVDEGDLESAIKVLREIRGSGNRLEIEVGVDIDDLDLQSRRGFRYDVFTHELMEGLGEKSMAKAATVGGTGGIQGRVGPKYLTRAIDAVMPELEAEMKIIKASTKL